MGRVERGGAGEGRVEVTVESRHVVATRGLLLFGMATEVDVTAHDADVGLELARASVAADAVVATRHLAAAAAAVGVNSTVADAAHAAGGVLVVGGGRRDGRSGEGMGGAERGGEGRRGEGRGGEGKGMGGGRWRVCVCLFRRRGERNFRNERGGGSAVSVTYSHLKQLILNYCVCKLQQDGL